VSYNTDMVDRVHKMKRMLVNVKELNKLLEKALESHGGGYKCEGCYACGRVVKHEDIEDEK